MKTQKLCIIGNSRTHQKNPITIRYTRFFISFIVDESSGEILDMDASVMLRATNEYIREVFIGRSLAKTDREALDTVERTYIGSSKKAIQMAYLDAVRKYNSYKGRILEGSC